MAGGACIASRLVVAGVLAVGAALSGCASTRVTLLPDHGGHVGAVTVSNARGERRIDQAFNTVIVKRFSGPAAPHSVNRQSFDKAHQALLDAQPTPPRTFMLNFLFDSMELTPASRKMLPEVLQVVRQRSPTEITVFGYTDSVGTDSYNLALSAQRARAVARLLRQIDPDMPIDVQYFGDKAPLVPTPRGVPEPRNRRAEIVIL